MNQMHELHTVQALERQAQAQEAQVKVMKDILRALQTIANKLR